MVEEIFYHRILRPNKAMSPAGQQMVAYILLALLLVLAPAIMATGLWILLLILLSPVAMMVMAFIYHNYKMRLYEEITMTRDRLDLYHVLPNGKVKEFHTDPHWVKIDLQKEGGPVENYLTLRDQNRHVEVGRFLSPEERKTLYGDLLGAKAKI